MASFDPHRLERIEIAEVFVPEGRRPVDAGKIASLAESLQRLGLLNPIIVHSEGGRTRLVAGHHRLAAAVSLGWSSIDAIFLDGDDVHLRLSEIAENLHRHELTAIERDELLAEWIRLTDDGLDIPAELRREPVSRQVDEKLSVRGRKGEGRPEGGMSPNRMPAAP